MPMRLMPWGPFFSVENHKNTNALIWCKFPGLPSELWSSKIVLSLGKTLGTPIQLDQSTLNHDYGYHASVLVDIDLSQPIPNHVFIDIEGKMINQETILHRVPKFCNHCKNVGHCIAECKGKQDPPITEVPSKTEKNKKVQSTSPPNKHTYFTESTAGKGTSDMVLGEWLAIKGRRGRSESPKSKTNVQLQDKESTNKYYALSEGDSVEQEKLTDMGMEEVKSQENLNNSNSKGVTQHSERVNSGEQYSPVEEEENHCISSIANEEEIRDAVFSLDGQRLNPPHVHPRASETGVIMQGEVLVGFITTGNVYHSKVLKFGEIFVIPRGLPHFQMNVGKGKAMVITAFNSQLPGTTILLLALFASNPPLPIKVLTKTFQVEEKVINDIKSKFIF
ncbi:hypothetical protein GIB67_005836 [Kingdonia uniflora]|uniref:Cupin type-1 domain-containing protein n=1 Tax=Kingdonia uniflora TaxID=39325 RepID=A0A7J7LUF6_9MAGN|nr:hypothetical protein GIB67_005836 [Kingdonia uniflora]